MKHKNYLFAGMVVILVVIVAIILVSIYNSNNYITTPEVQAKPSTLIFKLKSDYSGNYLGPITHNEETNTYDSSYTMALFDYCETKTIKNWVCTEDENTGNKDCYCKGNPNVEDEEYCLESEEEICFNMDSDEILKQGGVKKLQDDYYAVIYPSVNEMVQRFAVFDKLIDTKSEGARTPGDSIPMSREEFYSYVIDENPLIEAFFCDELEQNLNAVARDLSNGEIPVTCKQII